MNRNWLNKLRNHKRWRALPAIAFILLAGILIELLSLVQYNYAHSLVKEELDYRVESELAIKSIRVRSMLISNEKMVDNYLWPVQQQIHKPDNIPNVIGRLVQAALWKQLHFPGTKCTMMLSASRARTERQECGSTKKPHIRRL